jgi:hypothetical protein
MRSVFVHLADCTEQEVASFLDMELPGKRLPWLISSGADAAPALYIDFYSDHRSELEPAELECLSRAFAGRMPVTVIADVTGRIPGSHEVSSFVTMLLGRWSGFAQDDHSSRLWSIEEILRGDPIDGLVFFLGSKTK